MMHRQRLYGLSLRGAGACALGLLPGLLAPAYGQPSRSEAAQAADAMEEVVVRGQRSVNTLIRQGQQLTEDFYMRLNEVLDDDDFRISCDDERRTGSNIMDRSCRTGFQRRLEGQAASSAVQGLITMQAQAALQQSQGGAAEPTPPPIDMSFQAEALRWQAEFEQAILNAVNTDPVLNEQVIQLLALKSAIEDFRSPRELRREQRREERAAGESAN